MKKTIITLLVLTIAATVYGQTADRMHNIQIWGGGGLHTMKYTPANGISKMGWGAVAGFNYQFMFHKQWGVSIGAQISNLNSNATYDFAETVPNMTLPGALFPSDVTTTYYSWGEHQHIRQIDIPVELWFRTPISMDWTFQMGVGAAFSMPIYAYYCPSAGNYKTVAYMSQTAVTYEDLPSHGLGTTNYRDFDKANLETNKFNMGMLVDLGAVYNFSTGAGLYIGLYWSHAFMNTNANADVNRNLVDNLQYVGTWNSSCVGEVHPVQGGMKLALRFGAGKEIDWRAIQAAEEAALAERLAAEKRAEEERIAAEKRAEEERLAEEQRQKEEAAARALAEAEARAKAQADSIARVKAEEAAKAKAEAERIAAEQRAEAERLAAEQRVRDEAAAQARAEAEARAKAQADSVAKAHAAELARAKATADSLAAATAAAEARLRAEAEARARAEAEALERQRAEQRAREEAAFVAGYKDVAYFETGKDLPIFGELNEDSWDNLKSVMDSHPEIHVTVTGHTDNVGNKNSNLNLSQKRADNIRQMLISKGIDPKRIVAIGKGDTEPIDTNRTPEGRAKNRRIEITIGK